MGLSGVTRMDLRPDPQNPQYRPGMCGQRVGNRLRKSRQLIRGVVVDKDQFVVWLAQYLGKAVDTDRRPLVKIVPVTVVPAVNDDRDHPAASAETGRIARSDRLR